jgi:predicted ATPase
MLQTRSKTSALRFRDRIYKIGKASGLFQDVKIRNFGRGATAPFELDVVLDEKAFNVTNVGYGVSQALPVIVELLARTPGAWFAVQQPEVHLHPRAQAALGDLFFQLAVEEHKTFLIETHSDFTIDRFRLNYGQKKQIKPSSQILFFERKNGKNTVVSLPITDSGDLSGDQPKSYREFFIREQMNLLGI